LRGLAVHANRTGHPIAPDVAADVAALASRGVRLERYEGMQQDDAGVWTSPSGAKVAWFKDPDGNVLSLTEDAAAPLRVDEQRQRLTPAQESAKAKGFFAGEEREV
jgi:hypothetical protein